MKRFLTLAGCLSALILAACSGDSSFPEATGKGSIRAINAIETSPVIAFLIEERTIGSVAFKESSMSASYDDLSYNFNFEVLFIGDTARTRIATQPLDVVANKDYTFIISGAVSAPAITIWEGDQREWGEAETVTEFRFGHTAASEDPVDVYLAAPDVAPADGAEIGTLAFGEVLPAIEMPAGEYVVTITSAGDEADILFSSTSFVTLAATSLLFNLFDGDANDVSELALHSFNTTSGGTAVFTDSRLMPTLRFFHASKELGLVDIFIEDLLAMPPPVPLVSSHAFKDVTDDISVATGTLPLAYTTANEILMIHLQEDLNLSAAFRWNVFLFGPAGSPQISVSRTNRRSVETVAKFTLLQTASNHETTDLYIVDRGVDISAEDVFPTVVGITVSGIPISSQLAAGSYDLYLTTSGEKTEVAGPFELDVALGDVVQLIAYDVDDTALAEIIAIPPPAPAPPP
jgi:hypothetical protein